MRGVSTFDDVHAFLDTLGDDFRLWSSLRRPPDAAAIAATEARVGFPFPPEYREFLARYGALYLDVNESVWPRPEEFELRPLWQMCFGFWVHGVHEHPDLDVTENRVGDFWPVLRIAGLGLADAIGYDRNGRLARLGDEGIVPVEGTLADHVLAAMRRLADARERLRTEPIVRFETGTQERRSTITLAIATAASALPAALQGALEELGATHRVCVLDDDGDEEAGSLDDFATRTNDAILELEVEGRAFEVSASLPFAAGGPIKLFVQSVARPCADAVAARSLEVLERRLCRLGEVVERSTNF